MLYIDNIETSVETAAVRVEGGNRQLEKAVRHKVRTTLRIMRAMCAMIFTVYSFRNALAS